MRYAICFILTLLIVAGCSNTVPSNQESVKIENPTAEEILSTNRDADIFVVEGVVYSNALTDK